VLKPGRAVVWPGRSSAGGEPALWAEEERLAAPATATPGPRARCHLGVGAAPIYWEVLLTCQGR